MKRFGLVILTLLCLAGIFPLLPSGITQSAYNLIENAGSALARRTTLNFSGSITCADDSGDNRTNCVGSGGGGGTNTQTGNYTLQASDAGQEVIMNCSSSCTVTLYGSPTSTYLSTIQSIGSTTATVSTNSLNYNGTSTPPVLIRYQPITFYSDGMNYFGGVPSVAGSNITLTPAPNGLEYTASGGGGGASITVGSYTAQTCGASAFIFVANNSPINFFCDGSSHGLYKYGPFIITPFNTSDTAWFNQDGGTITADKAGAGIVLTGVATSGTSNTQGRLKSVPSTPYTQIGCFEPNLATPTGFPAAGIMLTNGTNTSTSGIIEYQYVINAANDPFSMNISKRTGVTGGGSNYTTTPASPGVGGSVCEAFQDDGTTRKAAYSFNKSDWFVMLSVSDTDFITPTEIGYYVNSLISNTVPAMHLFDWETVSGTLF
jgi:hypothetical protein